MSFWRSVTEIWIEIFNSRNGFNTIRHETHQYFKKEWNYGNNRDKARLILEVLIPQKNSYNVHFFFL